MVTKVVMEGQETSSSGTTKSCYSKPAKHVDIRNSSLVLKNSMDIRQSRDRRAPFLRDVLASVYNGKEVIVVADSGNQNIKTFWEDKFHQSIALDANPCKMTRMSLTEGAITVGNSTVLIFAFAPKLKDKQVIDTEKTYYGITWLGNSTFAVGCLNPGCIDVIDMDGNVLKTVGEVEINDLIFWQFKTPVFLCTTSLGNIAITDFSTRRMSILDENLEVLYSYPRIFPDGQIQLRNPLGIAGSLQGDLFIVDRENEAVLQVTKEGKFVRNVLTTRHNLEGATCIFMDENDTLFVAVKNRIVKTFHFSG